MGVISHAALEAGAEGMRDLWRDDAACAGLALVMDPPLDKRHDAAVRKAIAVCRPCPVRSQCRDWVLSLPAHTSPGWVVAGMTENVRAAVHVAEGRVPDGHRRCRDCLQVRLITDFYPKRRGDSARRWNCSTCHRAETRARYYARKGTA